MIALWKGDARDLLLRGVCRVQKTAGKQRAFSERQKRTSDQEQQQQQQKQAFWATFWHRKKKIPHCSDTNREAGEKVDLGQQGILKLSENFSRWFGPLLLSFLSPSSSHTPWALSPAQQPRCRSADRQLSAFLVQRYQHNGTVITLSRIKWIYVFGLGWNQLDTFVKESVCVCACVL